MKKVIYPSVMIYKYFGRMKSILLVKFILSFIPMNINSSTSKLCQIYISISKREI